MARSFKEREAILNSFADPNRSDNVEFKINHPEQDDKSFSEETLENLRDNVFLFIGGRLCAFHTKQDKPAKKLKVRIEVTVEA